MGEITFDNEMEVGQWHSETPDYSSAYNQWQPIETAPKDRPILLLEPVEDIEGEYYTFVGEWDKSRSVSVYGTNWACTEYDAFNHYPTHWMPLPPPPSKPIG